MVKKTEYTSFWDEERNVMVIRRYQKPVREIPANSKKEGLDLAREWIQIELLKRRRH